ncbi:MAG: hypothetical protein Q4C98_03365 [Capnocytophaga sp.]|nr:hypothetical protein [Capnocytophaga sp.]
MKQIIKNSLIGLGIYLLVGTIFYGYHAYMLPSFLLVMAMISFFSFRKKERKEVRNGLIWMNAPILAMLTVTSLFTDGFRVVLPYLIFTPLVAILVYYMIFPTKRLIFMTGILVLVAVSLLTFNDISGITDSFEGSYQIEMLSRLIIKNK